MSETTSLVGYVDFQSLVQVDFTSLEFVITQLCRIVGFNPQKGSAGANVTLISRLFELVQHQQNQIVSLSEIVKHMNQELQDVHEWIDGAGSPDQPGMSKTVIHVSENGTTISQVTRQGSGDQIVIRQDGGVGPSERKTSSSSVEDIVEEKNDDVPEEQGDGVQGAESVEPAKEVEEVKEKPEDDGKQSGTTEATKSPEQGKGAEPVKEGKVLSDGESGGESVTEQTQKDDEEEAQRPSSQKRMQKHSERKEALFSQLDSVSEVVGNSLGQGAELSAPVSVMKRVRSYSGDGASVDGKGSGKGTGEQPQLFSTGNGGVDLGALNAKLESIGVRLSNLEARKVPDAPAKTADTGVSEDQVQQIKKAMEVEVTVLRRDIQGVSSRMEQLEGSVVESQVTAQKHVAETEGSIRGTLESLEKELAMLGNMQKQGGDRSETQSPQQQSETQKYVSVVLEQQFAALQHATDALGQLRFDMSVLTETVSKCAAETRAVVATQQTTKLKFGDLDQQIRQISDYADSDRAMVEQRCSEIENNVGYIMGKLEGGSGTLPSGGGADRAEETNRFGISGDIDQGRLSPNPLPSLSPGRNGSQSPGSGVIAASGTFASIGSVSALYKAFGSLRDEVYKLRSEMRELSDDTDTEREGWKQIQGSFQTKLSQLAVSLNDIVSQQEAFEKRMRKLARKQSQTGGGPSGQLGRVGSPHGSISDSSGTAGGPGSKGKRLHDVFDKLLIVSGKVDELTNRVNNLQRDLSSLDRDKVSSTDLVCSMQQLDGKITGLDSEIRAVAASSLQLKKLDEMKRDLTRSVREVRLLHQSVSRQLATLDAERGSGGRPVSRKAAASYQRSDAEVEEKQDTGNVRVVFGSEHIERLIKLSDEVAVNSQLIKKLDETKADHEHMTDLLRDKPSASYVDAKANMTYVESLFRRVVGQQNELIRIVEEDGSQLRHLSDIVNKLIPVVKSKAEEERLVELLARIEEQSELIARVPNNLMTADQASLTRKQLISVGQHCISCDRFLLEQEKSGRVENGTRQFPDFPVTQSPQRPMTAHDVSRLQDRSVLPFSASGTITRGNRTIDGKMPQLREVDYVSQGNAVQELSPPQSARGNEQLIITNSARGMSRPTTYISSQQSAETQGRQAGKWRPQPPPNSDDD